MRLPDSKVLLLGVTRWLLYFTYYHAVDLGI